MSRSLSDGSQTSGVKASAQAREGRIVVVSLHYLKTVLPNGVLLLAGGRSER